MKLILDLLGPSRHMGARTRHELSSGSLTIGRSPEADWVIPDVERLISRLHLRIDANADAFVLTDTSANGTFLNGSAVPVGYGASAALGHDDRLRVGDARIAVTVVDRAGTGRSEGGSQPFATLRESSPRSPATSARDISDGPFGAGPEEPSQGRLAAPVQAAPMSQQAVDADWMIAPQPPAARSPIDADATARRVAGPGPLARRAILSDAEPAAVPATPSLLRLVEDKPALSIRRLAEAVDAAGQSLQFAVWQAFYDKVDYLVRAEQERPVDRTVMNGRVVG